ncbi:MAG: hypothetical protein M3M99_05400, partial [Actinomycetota bacterium]|nr:hypothetical protein [Actinomycetota bacterium]
DMRFEIVEMEEHGDQVLTRMRIRGGPAGGQTGMEVGVSSVTTFRGDIPARNEEFLDADEARRALVSPR